VTIQPGHRPAATPAGPHAPETLQRAAQIAAAVDAVYEKPTAVRVDDPTIPSWTDGPRIGTTPPVTDQPGARRAAMSQRAVDLNATILSSSVLAAALGGSTSAVLWASGQANPTVIAWICAGVVAAPAVIALPVLALKGLMKSAKEAIQAAPPEIHQHYNGYVDQRSTHIHSDTRAVIAVTKNTPELPR
jgi:hypothetical protein